ncbi:tetratricopeptide repeat protein [Nodosilinea sp. LEGE 07298]|uniref:tetratricopeptide repeat protein n=1 Tax=Nodosilinea sp. LEGE 07298 TaxID=2777970 RepID=UPI001880E331|nr:tetratricopeptide repeat protein [Nodosilinea sp. LEGE 07298]MBE9108587.1 tetratricopeptide repeat protein [Nodosilinea sp. LEGE 07298]
MSSQRRLKLFQTLSALPASQFEQLRFTLNPPPGLVPEGIAAQGNRVAALLSWVEGATGCGLERLNEVVEQVCPGYLDTGGREDGGESSWMVPYGRNPYFTGRDEVLTTLYQQLHEGQAAAISQTQAISGLGGIGKTQTAVEYAYRYRDDYRYVFWVGADTELELTSGYVAIAQRLNLPLKDAENQDETVQSVRAWLGREEGWLLIFDNGDRPELVQPFLPREIKGHILVTSRAQDFQDLGIVQAITMETLNPEDAVAFLLTRTARTHPVGANGVRPMQVIEPLADNPDGQSALRRDEIPPTPLEKGGGRPGATAGNSSPLSTRGARGDQNFDNEQSTEWKAATNIAAELGYLPLALEQAAAYIVTNRVSFADYLKSYRKQRLKRLEKAKPKLGHYADSIATTWALNLKEVQKTAPAAAALLNYCAFLHPDTIPFNLFSYGAAELGEPLATVLADAADDPLELYDLLSPLCSYSLVRVEPENQSFSLHRLVQEVIRAELGAEGCQNWVEPLFGAMGRLIPAKEKDIEYEDWPTLAPLVNHVQDLANHCQQSDIASTTTADMFHAMGTYLMGRGQYTLADPLLRQSLRLRQSLLRDEHEDIASSLDSLGQLENYQGRYEEAEPLYQDALAMRKRLLGDEHPDVALSLNNLGSLYSAQGLYKDAELIAQDSLDIRKRFLGKDHIETVQSFHWLAYLNQMQGRYNDAEILYLQVLEAHKRLLGDEHPSVASSLNNLAFLYNIQGRTDEAEPFYQEALAMRRRLLDDEHPSVANSLNNLAFLYSNQGRYGEAEILLLEAINLRRQLLGNEHPNLAISLNNLARCYCETANYDRAEALCQEALEITQAALPADHELNGRFLDDFATLRAAQGRTEEARSLYQQALAILEPKLGAEHPWTVRCRENLAKLG